MATDPNLYDVLGVSRQASHVEIREAYRARARRFHPDSGGAASDAGRHMADINRAWKVLSDPMERRRYDEALATGIFPDGVPAPRAREASTGVSITPLPPARVPWRLLGVLLLLGIGFVLLSDAVSRPTAPSKPDQLLTTGSCVVVDVRTEAVEVSCEDPHDGVVRQLVAFDRTCPVGTEPHRDRQGMGLACLDMVTEDPGAGVQDDGASG